MLKTHLDEISKELNNHHRNKSELLPYYIQLRLTKSLQTYYKDLNRSTSYLLERNSYNILRRM